MLSKVNIWAMILTDSLYIPGIIIQGVHKVSLQFKKIITK